MTNSIEKVKVGSPRFRSKIFVFDTMFGKIDLDLASKYYDKGFGIYILISKDPKFKTDIDYMLNYFAKKYEAKVDFPLTIIGSEIDKKSAFNFAIDTKLDKVKYKESYIFTSDSKFAKSIGLEMYTKDVDIVSSLGRLLFEAYRYKFVTPNDSKYRSFVRLLNIIDVDVEKIFKDTKKKSITYSLIKKSNNYIDDVINYGNANKFVPKSELQSVVKPWRLIDEYDEDDDVSIDDISSIDTDDVNVRCLIHDENYKRIMTEYVEDDSFYPDLYINKLIVSKEELETLKWQNKSKYTKWQKTSLSRDTA